MPRRRRLSHKDRGNGQRIHWLKFQWLRFDSQQRAGVGTPWTNRSALAKSNPSSIALKPAVQDDERRVGENGASSASRSIRRKDGILNVELASTVEDGTAVALYAFRQKGQAVHAAPHKPATGDADGTPVEDGSTELAIQDTRFTVEDGTAPQECASCSHIVGKAAAGDHGVARIVERAPSPVRVARIASSDEAKLLQRQGGSSLDSE
eukprot:7380226-Prymnesium_polylepis.4